MSYFSILEKYSNISDKMLSFLVRYGTGRFPSFYPYGQPKKKPRSYKRKRGFFTKYFAILTVAATTIRQILAYLIALSSSVKRINDNKQLTQQFAFHIYLLIYLKNNLLISKRY